jgi:ribose 5-phosphate isomerase B
METKRFDIITEADARVLEPGTTVRLAARGHITPLAADTLRERRITVIGEDMRATPPGMSLVPVADVRRIAIGSDHAGFDLKAHLIGVLRSRARQAAPSCPVRAPGHRLR